MRFPIRFSRLGAVLMTPLGLGRKVSWVEVDDVEVRVRMGWGFQAALPRSSIVRARPSERVRLTTGVHGWRGDWLVNGAPHGLVELEIDPPVPARSVCFPIRLRRLRVSLADPVGFLDALA